MSINHFYNQIQFPGHYAWEDLELQSQYLTNPYLKFIDRHLTGQQSVLDVGCGTGLISNLMSIRHPTSNFVGIDFADSIDYAVNFAVLNSIKNVQFCRNDFTQYPVTSQYDVVICQGVLHHIPESNTAIEKLKQLVKPGGTLILGVYHPWGKILKKFVAIDYNNQILFQDQECNPYERSYKIDQLLKNFSNFKFKTAYPCWFNKFISIPAFFNYRNGGLVTYVLEKYHEDLC
jgi:2-polyprenyl-3-methyl-5-hydroxy-6-metoxy-1,4-benzoquinol methylase